MSKQKKPTIACQGFLFAHHRSTLFSVGLAFFCVKNFKAKKVFSTSFINLVKVSGPAFCKDELLLHKRHQPSGEGISFVDR